VPEPETPSWGIEPVPDRLRVLGFLDGFLLWSNLSVSLLVIVAGAFLVLPPDEVGLALSLPQALAAIVAAGLVGNLLLGLGGLIGADARVPAMRSSSCSARSSCRSSPCCSPTGCSPAATTTPTRVFRGPEARPEMILAWLAGFCLYQWLSPLGPGWWTSALAHTHPHSSPWGGASLPSFAAAFALAVLARALVRDRAPRESLA
jgi:purine-cytosine permease-like protein